MKKVSLSKIRQYKDPHEHEYLNVNDRDLHPIRIDLPVPNNIETITNYGLDAKDQVFIREQYPQKLVYLERDLRQELRKRTEYGTVNQVEQAVSEKIWERLYNNYEKYKNEINWIHRQWYHRIHGKWYFINGRPTYINGMNWFYLNYWHLEQVGLPEYRDRDRRFFLGEEYLMKTTEAPVLDRKGNLMYRPDGSIVMEDIGSKTVFGSNHVKARQVGETSKTQCIGYEVVSRTVEGRGGIQAENENASEFVFKRKLILPFRRLPFFFRPTVKSVDPSKILEFASKDPEYGIDASIDYATTVYRDYYDGENLNFLHVDEAGKLDKRESVKRRHDVLYKCMQVLGGHMMYTSTVEDMGMDAGKEYFKLTSNSHFENRDDTKQTSSGLVNIFFPSQDGHKYFIGKFGESIIDNPTREQVPYLKKKITNRKGEHMGAREYLLAKRAELEKKGDLEGLIHEKRLEPMSFREAFTPPAQSAFFNRNIIEHRLGELQINPPPHVMRGNFLWSGGRFSNVVTFQPNSNGRWVISLRLDGGDANKIIKRGAVYWPNNGYKFIHCGDAFRVEKTDGGRMSDGGGAVMRIWDKTIDEPGKDVKEWETERFVATYLHRPPTVDEYVEDQLKMCIYYGAFAYPENNIDAIERKFKEWGYDGYLLYGFKEESGRRKKKNVAGFNTNGKTKPELFNKGRDWIENHGEKCEHQEILREFSEIRGPDDMTNYDLFASVVGCLDGQDVMLKMSDAQQHTGGFDLGRVARRRYY